MKVLVAEDDVTSRVMVAAVLGKWGYTVVSAADGDEAWSVSQEPDSPRLMILDWVMPGVSGPELCRKLRRHRIDEPLYIILLTSKGDNQDIIKGLESGADDYITKPYNHDELRVRIEIGARYIRSEEKIRDYAANMERLAEERARQLMHADRLTTIGILSAGIAHEINNPLAFIAVNIQTIEENWPSIAACLQREPSGKAMEQARLIGREMPEMLQDMKNGVARIRDIVDGLKTYARVENRKSQAVLINTCIIQALKLCTNRLKNRVRVETRLAEDLPPFSGDENRIEQVFVNLFINAADAMESSAAGAGELHIGTALDQGRILALVRDNGPGVRNGDFEKLFKPFFTTKAVGKGTGLGLSISRNIIEEHGGTITVRNHPDGGLEFRIELPQAPSGDRAAAIRERHQPYPQKDMP
ncbi:MAG: hybrid sensor histidine kinase/response regulator [Thermodesulfobacteriota bacterium]